jgi:hypothetical protein
MVCGGFGTKRGPTNDFISVSHFFPISMALFSFFHSLFGQLISSIARLDAALIAWDP